MRFIFCGKHPLLSTRIQVSDPGPNGPLVLNSDQLRIFFKFSLPGGHVLRRIKICFNCICRE